jgi:hypothetical protein
VRFSLFALFWVATASGAFGLSHHYVDCSAAAGDGSLAHPWNSLALVSAQVFEPGEVVALKRGTQCGGSLQLHGSGSAAGVVRLTAYGEGPRPRIVASNRDPQAVLLGNAEYWQIDSLDISGGNTYGLLVTGDQDKVQSHITLRNLVVHDVEGGELKSKDSGLVVFLRGSKGQRFDHVLIENVVAAHTNQWAGIMMGAGKSSSGADSYNRDVQIRNSVVHNVFGDGIILFSVRDGLIDASAAWLTGQQPSESVGTPNGIWTWSCTDCTVRNNEAFLTESPGVDGGAYDIDWATTRNTVEDNYAHDTQGYCVAVFGAGSVTHDAVVRRNLCVNNGLSPRMAALQGAIYIRTWNGGAIDGLTIEKNTIVWNPPGPAPLLVNERDTQLAGSPLVFRDNVIRTSSPALMQSFGDKLKLERNRYEYHGAPSPHWEWDGTVWHSLSDLQQAGAEQGSELSMQDSPLAESFGDPGARPQFSISSLTALPGLDGKRLPVVQSSQATLIVAMDLKLDADGLLAAETMTQLSVLRTLAREYAPRQLQIVVAAQDFHVDEASRNALLDLDVPSVRFVRAPADMRTTTLVDSSQKVVAQWEPGAASHNAAAIGYAVRRELGAPVYAQMDKRP